MIRYDHRDTGRSVTYEPGRPGYTGRGVELAVPRDRNGSFAPRIVRKGQTRLDGFNERITALYARGLTTRDIRAHLRELYDVDVSPDLISRVTDGARGIDRMAGPAAGPVISRTILRSLNATDPWRPLAGVSVNVGATYWFAVGVAPEPGL